MNGDDGVTRRRKSLAERLRFKGVGCCGSTWGIFPTTTLDDVADDVAVMSHHRTPSETASRMDLATALAAERQFRAAAFDNNCPSAGPDPDIKLSPSPKRVSLMRLLEETDVYDGELMEKEEIKGSDESSKCCVCMHRKKGAAFIPCGHTFCRVCSRELWVNRGCCPLCNKSILEILDIY